MKPLKPWIKSLIVFGASAAGVLVLDLVSKTLTDGVDVSVIPKFISFESAHNDGMAWSLFSGGGIWIILFTCLLAAAAVTFWRYLANGNSFKIKKDLDTKPHKAALLRDLGFGFFVGGAVGNIIDRMAFGYVRDFIKFDFMNFPIFNFADVLLDVGVVLLIVYFVFYYGRKVKRVE